MVNKDKSIIFLTIILFYHREFSRFVQDGGWEKKTVASGRRIRTCYHWSWLEPILLPHARHYPTYSYKMGTYTENGI